MEKEYSNNKTFCLLVESHQCPTTILEALLDKFILKGNDKLEIQDLRLMGADVGRQLQIWEKNNLVVQVSRVIQPPTALEHAIKDAKKRITVEISYDTRTPYSDGILALVEHLVALYRCFVVVKDGEFEVSNHPSPWSMRVNEALKSAKDKKFKLADDFFITQSAEDVIKTADADWIPKTILSYQKKINRETQYWYINTEGGSGNQVAKDQLNPIEGNTVLTCWSEIPTKESKPLATIQMYTDFPLSQVKFIVRENTLRVGENNHG
jgi:hypothetical protein